MRLKILIEFINTDNTQPSTKSLQLLENSDSGWTSNEEKGKVYRDDALS